MISMDKRYRTRDGRTARVICVDKNDSNNQSVLALVTNPSGKESVTLCFSDGRYCLDGIDDPSDLIEIPELEFDWSCLPKWAKWITRNDRCTSWIWWSAKPIRQGGAYGSDRVPYGIIPNDFAPRYHGSDPAPIFQRPTEEGE